MPDDIQLQRNHVAHDLKIILEELYVDYPWIVAEMVYLMYQRMDKHEPFLKVILSDILQTLTDENIDSVMECSDELEKEDYFTGITGRQMSFYSVQKKLSLPAFSLQAESHSFCEPTDNSPTNSGIFEDGTLHKKLTKLKLAQILHRDKELLLTHRAIISQNNTLFIDEITCIDIILETIDLRN